MVLVLYAGSVRITIETPYSVTGKVEIQTHVSLEKGPLSKTNC